MKQATQEIVRDEGTDDPRGEATHGPVDPAPSPVAMTESSINHLIDTLDTETRKDWTATRDTMDALMNAHREDGEGIKATVIAYASRSEQLITVSKIVRESVENARKEIAARPPATITQLPQRRRTA